MSETAEPRHGKSTRAKKQTATRGKLTRRTPVTWLLLKAKQLADEWAEFVC